jgi:hypothetical protein
MKKKTKHHRLDATIFPQGGFQYLGRYITIQSFNVELINLAVGLMTGISSKSKDNSLSYEYNGSATM